MKLFAIICWITKRHKWRRPRGAGTKYCLRCGFVTGINKRVKA